MKTTRFFALMGGLAAVTLGVSYFTSLFAQPLVPEDPRPAAVSPEELQPIPEDSVEVQTSGPIHEAFAIPPTTDVPDSIIVQQPPPEPIEELPPEQKPEGSNVIWIPGYYGWDEVRNDFIWISGFWRDIPPGRVWVSGYWATADNGYQWVPGFWTSAEQNEVEYLPQPPEIVETGPSIAQPSQNHFWVPGNWSWVVDHYVWRPGYWSQIQPDWVWVPAHYVWCPSGYVFVDGFWDYPVVRRGLLFAPVYFAQSVYRRPYYYTPSIVWSTSLLTQHLWVRPAYYHYYFGNYYDNRFANWGIRPWYLSFTFGNVSYDPLFSYYRWYHRDVNWVRSVRNRYDYYRRNPDFRPPRTYRELQRIVSRTDNRNRIRDAVVAAPITQIVNNTTVNNISADVINANFRTSQRFDRVAQQDRRRIARQADELRSVVRQRRKIETRENVARVEEGRREGARKGEDERVRRPARQGLDISNVAQAMGAAPDRRGAASRRSGDETARGRSGRDSDRGQESDRAAREARVGDRGPALTAPDRGPDLRLPGQGAAERGRDRASGRDAAADVRDRARAARRAEDTARRADRNTVSPRERRAEPRLPQLDRADGRNPRGVGRDAVPSIPGIPDRGAASPVFPDRGPSIDRSVPQRGRVEQNREGQDRSQRGRVERGPVERGPASRGRLERGQPLPDAARGATSRELRSPGQLFSSDPANVMRRPGGFDRQSIPQRAPQARSPIERDMFRAPRGRAGTPPATATPRSADPVAPLRLGGPERSIRGPSARPQVRSRPEVPSARELRSTPGGSGRGREEGGGGGRGKGRDKG